MFKNQDVLIAKALKKLFEDASFSVKAEEAAGLVAVGRWVKGLPETIEKILAKEKEEKAEKKIEGDNGD